MADILVTNREGTEVVIHGKDGFSLMELIRGADIADPFALCGGACSCATCHVYIDETGFADLPAMAPEEDDVLEGSTHRRAQSRLSCQVAFTSGLDGLRVTIAPVD